MSYPMSEMGAAVARRARSAVAMMFAIAAALAVSYAPAQAQQTGVVTGTVTSQAGDPLTDVVVQVVGTDPLRSAVTDNRGRYAILNVPTGARQVQATIIGYGQAQQDVTVPAGGTVVADFRLQQRAVELEGMVVTGTAINAQKREVGNSIELITSEQIEASGATKVEDILRGQVAGLQVSGTSANVGVGAELNIRGLASINGRRAPLIYVDGVRVGSEDGAVETATGESGALHILGSISPSDIDRIEIIKGAAASTLYGTDAGAGVIQIFTKRGQAGERARWTFSSQTSLTEPSHFGPGKDIDPTGMHMNRCDINGPLPQDTVVGGDPDCPESGSWFKNAWSQNYNLQARGGSETFSYFASGGYQNQQGVINTPTAESLGLRQQINGSQAENVFLRANFTFSPWDELEVQINTSYSNRVVDFVPDGEGSSSLVRQVTRLTDDDTENHDAQVFLRFENQDVDQYTISSSLSWLPTDNQRHRFNVGFDRTISSRIDEFKRGHFAEDLGSRVVDIEGNRVITLDYAGSQAWTLPGADAYTFTTSWGGQLNDRRADGLFGAASEFITRNRTQTELAAELDQLTESYDAFINGGFFLQQQIGWNNLIFLTGGVRLDTYNTINERLESVPLYSVFPKLQATYTISDHDWFPNDVIETLRLRGAWGTAGDPPPQTASRTLWDTRNTGRGGVGFNVNGIGNVDIEPERVTEWEAGADISAFQGRLGLSGQYFFRATRDGLIFNDPVPSLGIIEPQAFNAGEWDTWGYEATLDANVVERPDFRWNVNSTLSYQASEIFDIGLDENNQFNVGEGGDDGFASFRVGTPLGAIFTERILNDSERGALPEYSEEEFRGVQVPPYELSVNTSFGIGERLTLDFFGYGHFGHLLVDGQAVNFAEDGLWPACVGVTEAMNAWREAGADPDAVPDTYDNDKTGGFDTPGGDQPLTAGLIARCDENFPDDTDPRDWYDEADFFRFSSASAQYRLPTEWLPGGLTGATLQFQALNLNLFTDFRGTDPDAIRGAGLQQRSRALGFIIPLPRTYSFNVRLNF